ncbi:MAG: hypothetical protein Ctma_0587 [Catillopecten margaritatus gill symbiont]|uniref:Peptidase metallopeptidase domain-containing protein n=1 Tax=Catillopecten margaritatus gill symbiont TaxID=3083288 RepID=A0AAU6PFV2_9GAMM
MDLTPPTATLTTTESTKNNSNVVVQSNETGYAYLVKNGETIPTTKVGFDTLATGNTANTVAIGATNTATNLPTTNLEAGTYKLYTIDGAGNISAVSASGVTIIPTPAHSHTINTVGTLATPTTTGVSSLDSGIHWNVPTDRKITYSFNTAAIGMPSDYNNAGYGIADGWAELSDAQKTAVRSVMTKAGELVNINFTEVADTTAQSDGDIQFNITNTSSGTNGYAYSPGTSSNYSGDIFLSSTFNTNPAGHGLNAGESGWSTIAHELGHALGLKHPFSGSNPLLPGENNKNHTIMSYNPVNAWLVKFTATSDSTVSFSGKYLSPELFSLYDVAALQAHYGVNDNTNTGDTTYSYEYTDYERNTIWDAGGVDLIDLSMCIGNSNVDLNPGSLSSVDQYTMAQVIQVHQNSVGGSNSADFIRDKINAHGAGVIYTGKDNLGIATGTIIENVLTGVGNDIIIDNLVDNIIKTGAGDDNIHIGQGGYDTIDGGLGTDKLYIDAKKEDITYTAASANGGEYGLLTTSSYTAQFKGIETLYFQNGETIMV